MPLIVFEGIDGCGKTTQLNFVYDWLKSCNRDVIATRQPGCSLDVCMAIANIVKSPGVMLTPLTETLLFMADRTENVDKVILPALKKGSIVLCDRWTHSTLAYQHYGRGVDRELIDDLNITATRSIMPDLMLYFDIEPYKALSRVKRGKDRIEAESLEFYNKVHQGYFEIIEQSKIHHRVAVIDADNDPLEVFRNVKEKIKNYIL